MYLDTGLSDQADPPPVAATPGRDDVRAAATGALRLRLTYPDQRLAVLHAAGELDTVTTPRLAALIWPRLQSTLEAFVLDLREVTFLGVAGLELLTAAQAYAAQRDIAFGVLNSTRIVDRALAAGGLEEILPCFATEAETCSALLHPTGELTSRGVADA